MHDETWIQAEAEQAELIISTVPIEEISEKILELDVECEKILRTDDLENAARYLQEGAYYVSVDDILTGEVIREHVIGITGEKDYREELRRRNLLEVRRYLKENEG